MVGVFAESSVGKISRTEWVDVSAIQSDKNKNLKTPLWKV